MKSESGRPLKEHVNVIANSKLSALCCHSSKQVYAGKIGSSSACHPCDRYRYEHRLTYIVRKHWGYWDKNSCLRLRKLHGVLRGHSILSAFLFCAIEYIIMSGIKTSDVLLIVIAIMFPPAAAVRTGLVNNYWPPCRYSEADVDESLAWLVWQGMVTGCSCALFVNVLLTLLGCAYYIYEFMLAWWIGAEILSSALHRHSWAVSAA